MNIKNKGYGNIRKTLAKDRNLKLKIIITNVRLLREEKSNGRKQFNYI